jgi:hypothetical protein
MPPLIPGHFMRADGRWAAAAAVFLLMGCRGASGAKAVAAGPPSDGDLDEELEQFALDEVTAEGGSLGAKRRGRMAAGDSSGEEAAGEEAAAVDKEKERPKPYKTQVIFCSRTHSQLSQFVGEFKRTPLPGSVSVVALAARKVGGRAIPTPGSSPSLCMHTSVHAPFS